MSCRSAALRSGAALALCFGLAAPSAAQSGGIVSAVTNDIANLKALLAPRGAKRMTSTADVTPTNGVPGDPVNVTKAGALAGTDTDLPGEVS